MKQLLTSVLVFSAVGVLAVTARAFTLPPPDPGTTVYITDCGTNPQVTIGSSPFSGSVVPDTDTIECRIYFDGAPFPFGAIVDGSTVPGDYIAPICNVQIQGPRTKYTVAVTAAGIHAIWDTNIVEPVVPPQLVTWVCYYPWAPAGQTNLLQRRPRATPPPRSSAH